MNMEELAGLSLAHAENRWRYMFKKSNETYLKMSCALEYLLPQMAKLHKYLVEHKGESMACETEKQCFLAENCQVIQRLASLMNKHAWYSKRESELVKKYGFAK